MTLDGLLTICKCYADLGWAVQEQLLAIDEEASAAEQNPNAVKMIVQFLEQVCESCPEDDDEELRAEIAALLDEIHAALEDK